MALASLVIITAFSGHPPGLGKMLRNCLLLTMKELFIGGNLTRRTQLPMLFGKRSMIIKKLTTERLKTRRPGTLQLWKERNLRQLKTLLCTGPRMVWSLCSWMTTTVTACLHWVWVMGCVTLVTPPRTASLTCLVSINCATQAAADHLQVMCGSGHSTSYGPANRFGVDSLYDPGCKAPRPEVGLTLHFRVK